MNITSLGNGIAAFARRFHTILFFLIVSGGLFVAILTLLSTISLSSTTATSSDQTVNGTFDEDTIQRLNAGSVEQVSPGARPSPFTE